ncbi:Zinc finger protein 76 [Phytophthora cinnamomi]|uniref:Zinc finger protein 76 n=1 Tax=Phytophthora cinnamomi TaxID=4785 RepID=UPI003559F7CD|nr:Zinc finger protein 76 [Phytophthora cinnamomi]
MKTQHRSVPLPANSRGSRQQQHRQRIQQQLQQQQAAKVVSPVLSSRSPCDEFPIMDFDMLTFLPPVEEQLQQQQQFSFLDTPVHSEALSDEDLKDLLECLF